MKSFYQCYILLNTFIYYCMNIGSAVKLNIYHFMNENDMVFDIR